MAEAAGQGNREEEAMQKGVSRSLCGGLKRTRTYMDRVSLPTA